MVVDNGDFKVNWVLVESISVGIIGFVFIVKMKHLIETRYEIN